LGASFQEVFSTNREEPKNMFYGIKKPHSSEQPSFNDHPKGFTSSKWWACWRYSSKYQNWGDNFFMNMMFDKAKQDEFKTEISISLEELLPLINQLS
jgi:hypothetical protein